MHDPNVDALMDSAGGTDQAIHEAAWLNAESDEIIQRTLLPIDPVYPLCLRRGAIAGRAPPGHGSRPPVAVRYPMQRREALRAMAVLPAVILAQDWLQRLWAAASPGLQDQSGPSARIRVLVELRGRRRPPKKGAAGPLAGSRARTISLRDPDEFLQGAGMVRSVQHLGANCALKHRLDVQREISRAASDGQTRLRQVPSQDTNFPATRIDKPLETAARLLPAHTPIAVINVTHGSLDTHAGQIQVHQCLLEELAQTLRAIRAALLSENFWDHVMVTA